MTEEREKELAKEWWNKGADEYDHALFSDRGRKMLEHLIHTVVAEARKEAIDEIMEIGKKAILPDGEWAEIDIAILQYAQKRFTAAAERLKEQG